MKKYIKQILPIEKWNAVYAVLFALMSVTNLHIVNEDVERSTVLTTYLTSFRPVDIVLFIVFAAFTYLAIKYLSELVKAAKRVILTDRKVGKPVICFLLILLVIMLSWIPYFMSYWPGGIYNDTLDSIHIALGQQQMDNQNTVLYALFWRLIFAVGNIADQGAYGGLKLMTVFQATAIAVTAAAFFTWLRKKGVRVWVIAVLTAIIAFMPVFPFYAISLWKDTLFGVGVFLYSWLIFVMVTGINDEKKTVGISLLVRYILLSLLLAFGRNNGIYIVIVMTIVLGILFYKKGNRKDANRIVLTSVSVIFISLIIQIPVYNACGVIKSDPVEKYGIPLQQVGYIVSSGGKMSADEEAVIESILTKDGWINLYNPTVVDTIKFDPLFNSGYFNTHTGDFVKAYLGMIVRNPVLAVKGYLLATMGFWDVWQTSSSAYICNTHCYNCEFFMSDYFNQYTGLTLSNIVGPRWYISSGLLVWIMLLAVCIVLQKRNYRMLVPVLPAFILWGTLLMATPLAFSFRYVFPLLLCLPLFIMSAGRTVNSETNCEKE